LETKRIGVLTILCASILWAIEPVLAKLAYRNADFLQTSALRAIFVALTALPYAVITNRGSRAGDPVRRASRTFRGGQSGTPGQSASGTQRDNPQRGLWANLRRGLRVSRGQFPKLLYIAIAGTVVADLAYYFSLTRIPVINAVLIGHMQPIFIVLLGFIILREDRLTKFDYLGIFIMLVAGLLVTTKTMANLSMLKFGTSGDLFVLLATFAWATTAIVMRKYLRDMNAGVLVFYRFSIGAFIFVAYLLLTSAIRISNIYQILLGVLVGVGSILYYESLKRIKAAQVSALELSTPFFAAFLGFLVLKESITAMQVLGIALLFAGVHFLSRREEAYF
jgi:drug/metabolite transporter (DMT)-like permease